MTMRCNQTEGEAAAAAEKAGQSPYLASRYGVGSVTRSHTQQKHMPGLHCAQILQPTCHAKEGSHSLHGRVCSLRAGKMLRRTSMLKGAQKLPAARCHSHQLKRASTACGRNRLLLALLGDKRHGWPLKLVTPLM